MVAGAVISGAYFGDKLSPLSDTTNLAPAMAGTDLFTHIRYMTYTTVPSIVITLIVFLFLGFFQETNGQADTQLLLDSIDERFTINLGLFIVPLLVIFMIVRKAPPLVALMIGTLLGGGFALLYQPHLVLENAGAVQLNITSAYRGIPVEGITTGVYGSQRILNGKPRRPHFGIDIAAKKGTIIKNSNNGEVLLSEKNLFFTGGTIIIDHGHGVITIYSHLNEIFVKKGDLVKRGEGIGTVGSTGRSTGPHLDFRIYCNNVPVDPDLILSSN